jgi:hypothetical protein
MQEYIIVNPSTDMSRPYISRSIVGTIKAKIRSVALAKAIEITRIPNPIILISSAASNDERHEASLKAILWTQPEPKPKTATNPRGSGPRAGEGEVLVISTRTRVDRRAWNWYHQQENKSSTIARLIEAAANQYLGEGDR